MGPFPWGACNKDLSGNLIGIFNINPSVANNGRKAKK
jgi:hypothetical protein